MIKPCLGAILLASAPPLSAAADGWEFEITPHGWLLDAEGSVGALPGQPPVEIDVSFKDVLDDVDYGGMLFLEARKDEWLIRGDLMFSRISTDADLGGLVFRSIDVVNKLGFVGATVGRVLDRGERHTVEGNVGFRTWWLETEVEIGTIAPAPIELDGDAVWTDPVVAFSGSYDLTGNWSLRGMAEVGGLGVGSDISAGALLTAHYALGDWFSLVAGWRNIYVKYEDELAYDVNHTGPLIGASFRF